MLTQPVAGEVTPELVKWLQTTDWQQLPLREVTRMLFVLIVARDGEPAFARLCVWRDGAQGGYTDLAYWGAEDTNLWLWLT